MKDFKGRSVFSLVLGLFLSVGVVAQVESYDPDIEAKRKRQIMMEENYNPSDFDPSTVSVGRLKKLAKSAMKIEDYYTVVDYLKVYMEKKPDDLKRAYWLAEAARKTRDYKLAEDWYGKIVASSAAKKYPKAQFYYATVQKQNGFYEEAPGALQAFKKTYKGKDERTMKKLVKSEAEGAEVANMRIQKGMDSSKVVIVRLTNDINQETMEFSPTIIDRNQFVYSSLMADVEDYYSLEGIDRPDRKLYIAEKIGPNEWQRIEEFPGPFNKEGYDITSGAYSPDGLSFYYSVCPKKPEKKDKCAIYVSQFRDGNWLGAERLGEPINYDKYNSTQPSVGQVVDRRSKRPVNVLFFVSDREEKSKGGKDIWYSVFDSKKGGFVKVKNAGSKVNTVGDEVSPFYDGFEGLYFSSNGHPNLGGFDIYLSKGNPSARFSEAKPLLYPINSPADDISYTVHPDGDFGFFISNREGGNNTINPTCCDDIYQFINTDFIKIGAEGVVFEDNNQGRDKRLSVEPNATNFLEDVKISLLQLDGADTIVLQEDFPNPGESYSFSLRHGEDYIISASKEYYYEKLIPVSTKRFNYSDTVKINIGIEKMPPKEIYIPKVYFETNRFVIDKATQEELIATIVPALKENTDLNLIIKGYADDIGSTEYNKKLSLKRANSVLKFLKSNNIDPSRFVVEGFGENDPAASIEVYGEAEARRLNRRVEFEIDGNERYIMAEQ